MSQWEVGMGWKNGPKSSGPSVEQDLNSIKRYDEELEKHYNRVEEINREKQIILDRIAKDLG
jgi:hypothetical protein